MRYHPEHKTKVRQKIVKDAARRVRAEGLNGAAVTAVMRDTGLTHGGFYKHFQSKDELVLDSLRQAFREIADKLVQAAGQSPRTPAWKTIVKLYLSPAHCAHPERGCPVAALAPDLTRARRGAKRAILSEIATYRMRLLPYMPGRRTADKERAFLVIFSTMIGAVQIARLTPDPVAQEKLLARTRRFLLRTF